MYLGNSNDTTNKKVNLLIDSGFYYNVVTDKVYREPPSCSVAVDSILGWILCGPTRTRKVKRQENVNFITFVTMRIETKQLNEI